MPSQSFRVGVANVQLSVDSSTALPALTTLAFTASAITTTTTLVNDVKTALSASPTYQVMLGLVGRDTTNQGYTVGRCSPSSGNLTITAGQGIRISVANAAWPANFNEAVCVAVFLKIGAADFQLAEFAYIDTANDFVHTVTTQPSPTAITKTAAILQSTTADDDLGDREPLGFTRVLLGPTQGGVQVSGNTGNVPFDPDNGSPFQLATFRTTGVSFSVLTNGLLDVVRANAGNYVKYTLSGTIYEETQMSLQTAQALVTGNKPLWITLPRDPVSGQQEVRLLLGQLTRNQSGRNESWTKNAPTTLQYNFQAAALDRLLTDQHTEIGYVSNA